MFAKSKSLKIYLNFALQPMGHFWIFFGIIFCTLLSHSKYSAAESTVEFTESEYHFLVGYDAFLKKDYGQCATHLLQADSLSEQFLPRAKLYLASCQKALGYKEYAAAKIHFLSDTRFSKDDSRLYRQLRNELWREIQKLNQIWVSISPYYGILQYNPNNIKTGGTLIGAGGSISYQGFTARLSAERLTLGLANGLSDYTQGQFYGGLTHWSKSGDMFRATCTLISSSLNSLDSIQIYGLGTGTSWSSGNITFDLNYSTYPNSTLQSLKLFEGTFALYQRVIGWSTGGIFARVASQTIFPQADTSVDSTSGFSLRSSYERGSLDLIVKLDIFELGGSGWIGNEAFGVRNEGALVYNALEEHQSGWGTYLGIQFDSFTLRTNIARENYTVGTIQANSTTYLGSASFNF